MTSMHRFAVRTLAASSLSALAVTTAAAQGIGGLLPTAESDPPTRQGSRGANFLHLPVGARANAMAGAAGSSTTGSLAWFVNPAGAATIESFSMAAGRQNLYGNLGITQNFAAVSFPLFGGAIGAAVNSLNSGDMHFTTEGNPFGNPLAGETFQWTSTAVSLGFARRLTDRLDVGAAMKYINEGLPQVNSSWISADIGTQFRTGLFGIVLGGSLAQVGTGAAMDGIMLERGVNTNDFARSQTRVKLFTRTVELPTAFRFAIGDDILGTAESLFGRGSGDHTVYAELTLDDAVDLAVQAGLGAEYSFRNLVFVRGGKRFYNDDRAAPGQDGFLDHGLSGGFGLRLPVAGRAIRFDYSYTAVGDLRDIQLFSFDFGGR
jgi:hypothetical protein